MDDRVHLMEHDAYHWGAYTQMEQAGLLSDVETLDWKAGGTYFRYLHVGSIYNLGFGSDVLQCTHNSNTLHRSHKTSTANN